MTCDRIRPLLYRLAEQEADPAEAIEAARHLPRCTACKILLARERRLAVLLERELVDLAVDETFVREVMDTLPTAPPRRAALRRCSGARRRSGNRARGSRRLGWR